MSTKLRVRVGDRWYTVELEDLRSNPVRVLVDGEPVEVSIEGLIEDGPEDGPPGPASDRPAPAAARVYTSPMPGVIVSVAVKVGDQVVTGDEICVLEAMKMQQTLRADWTGVVRTVHVLPGQQVLDGDTIVDLE